MRGGGEGIVRIPTGSGWRQETMETGGRRQRRADREDSGPVGARTAGRWSRNRSVTSGYQQGA